MLRVREQPSDTARAPRLLRRSGATGGRSCRAPGRRAGLRARPRGRAARGARGGRGPSAARRSRTRGRRALRERSPRCRRARRRLRRPRAPPPFRASRRRNRCRAWTRRRRARAGRASAGPGRSRGPRRARPGSARRGRAGPRTAAGARPRIASRARDPSRRYSSAHRYVTRSRKRPDGGAVHFAGVGRSLGEEPGDAGGVEVPAPDLDERPGQAPHHLPEKVRGRDAEVDLARRFLDLARLDDDDRRLLAFGVLTERSRSRAALRRASPPSAWPPRPDGP